VQKETRDHQQNAASAVTCGSHCVLRHRTPVKGITITSKATEVWGSDKLAVPVFVEGKQLLPVPPQFLLMIY
jgi:hypothetical protein